MEATAKTSISMVLRQPWIKKLFYNINIIDSHTQKQRQIDTVFGVGKGFASKPAVNGLLTG